MKKLLIISYAFPPMAAVGVYRILKFCKFLPQFGWQPTILTVKVGFNYALDETLLRELDPQLRVYRSANWDPVGWWDRRRPRTPSKAVSEAGSTQKTQPTMGETSGSGMKALVRQLLTTPDESGFWILPGTVTGYRAARTERATLVLSTSPPASAHVIGLQIATLLGLPYVADFRDLWTQNESYDLLKRPTFLRRVDRWLERKVIARAAAVTTASDRFSESLRSNNRDVDPSRVYTITNGLDPDDFRDIKFPSEKNKRFTILHLGSLYGRRDPTFFFNALGVFADRRPEAVANCEVRFIGNTPGAESYITDSRARSMVRFISHVPHRDVLTELWAANLLLLVLGFDKETAGVIPAKLFEYIATGRPILALVPEGEAKRLIGRHSSGYCLTGPDIETAVNYLQECYDNWKNAVHPPPSSLHIPEEFNRREQSRKLAGIFDEISSRDRSH